MNKVLSLFLIASFTISGVVAADTIDTHLGCKSNPAVVAACFSIRGRVFASNGTPSMRIWVVSTKRLLGVVPAEREILPDNLRGMVTFEQSVYADLEVCPITQSRPGVMQLVCIESVAKIVIHRKK